MTTGGTQAPCCMASDCIATISRSTPSAPGRSLLLTQKILGDLHDAGLEALHVVAHARHEDQHGVVSTRPVTPTSSCPTPTVSTMRVAKPAASMRQQTLSASPATPPRVPREAMLRMKTPRSPTKPCMRMRSPSSAPPVMGRTGDRWQAPRPFRPARAANAPAHRRGCFCRRPGGR